MTRPASARRAASSTRAAPSAVTATLSAGSAITWFTSAMAARWNTGPQPLSASVSESWSRRSTSAHSASAWSGGRWSRTRTAWPAPSSASTTCEPMNPEPPVTAIVSCVMVPACRGAGPADLALKCGLPGGDATAADLAHVVALERRGEGLHHVVDVGFGERGVQREAHVPGAQPLRARAGRGRRAARRSAGGAAACRRPRPTGRCRTRRGGAA